MKPVFEFIDVSYAYPGRNDGFVLQGFNISIPAGEKIAVVGRNGSGKSTFFLHCNGLFRPVSGQVLFKGKPLVYTRKALMQLRQQVGLVFQNPDDQLFNASVTQDISFGPLNLGLDTDEVRLRVAQAAEACEITHLLERPTHALSGGEKARAALAGVLAMEPEVLLADEPMTSLDPWAKLAIFDIFQRFYDQGKTILMATHSLSVVRYWASYVVVLQAGQAVFSGTPQELLADHAVLGSTGLSKVWWKVDPAFPQKGVRP
ncbi:MAG: energy-coupling factor ABC transporter ATP-binding protein [Chloroflexota bacterium]